MGNVLKPVQEMLEYLGGIADDLGLEDDERDSFINSSMERKGYKQTSSWAEPDDGGGRGGDFFSGRRQGGQQRGRQGSSGFTQYRTGS